jgi:hypothetical protein
MLAINKTSTALEVSDEVTEEDSDDSDVSINTIARLKRPKVLK